MVIEFTLNEYMVFIDELVKWHQNSIYSPISCESIGVMKSPDIKKTSYVEFMSIRIYAAVDGKYDDVNKILNSQKPADKLFAARMKSYFTLAENPNEKHSCILYQDVDAFTSDEDLDKTIHELSELCKQKYENVVINFDYSDSAKTQADKESASHIKTNGDKEESIWKKFISKLK